MAESKTVRIERLAPAGDGVATAEAGPVYVPQALPAETWRAPDAEHAGWQLIAASPDRQAPPCRHFTRCGGCSAQHMGDRLYRQWKHDAVVRAFAAHGLAPDIAPLVAAAPQTRRRAVLTARRRGGEVALGYHGAGTHTLVDLAECPVLEPPIVAAFPVLREIARCAISDDGEVRLTVLRLSAGLDVSVETGKRDLGSRTRQALAEAAQAGPIQRLVVDDEIIVQRGPARIDVGGVEVEPPPGVFVQAVPSAEQRMIEEVVAAVGRARSVADLFSGLGTFSFALARRARVLAVDGDRRAIEALGAAVRAATGLKPIEARVRDLFREPLSRKELEPFEAVVLDPPRAGAKAQAAMLAKSAVPTVVAVSCNPATLARDVRLLVDGGYALGRVVAIDQFLWSGHVEVVAVLVKR